MQDTFHSFYIVPSLEESSLRKETHWPKFLGQDRTDFFWLKDTDAALILSCLLSHSDNVKLTVLKSKLF